ncbi:leucine-rich repeat domain-containing protein [Mangrovicoccus ximenensis]|uniref:leucine-rich repeat domain-containing protein n=1 Tax=Mangrovicoccus ximenensis TaxID=1911570 RepID=UPI000D362600|nr:leucine-rich repeat domain-containing protein [Mangrovicoccus ximenensis]
MPGDNGTDQAEALRRIREAEASGAAELSLYGLAGLDRLPPELAQLDRLSSLDLGNTGITDIDVLARLPGLQIVQLVNTPALRLIQELEPLMDARDLRIFFRDNPPAAAAPVLPDPAATPFRSRGTQAVLDTGGQADPAGLDLREAGEPGDRPGRGQRREMPDRAWHAEGDGSGAGGEEQGASGQGHAASLPWSGREGHACQDRNRCGIPLGKGCVARGCHREGGMEILEGALAFSVVMIVLATIVSGLTEAWLRNRRTRQAFLAVALARMIRDVAAGQVPQLALRNGGARRDWIPRLVDELTFNPVHGPLEELRRKPGVAETARQWIADLAPASHYKVFLDSLAPAAAPDGEADTEVKLRNVLRVDTLSPRGFAERFARLEPYGSQLATEGEWRLLVETYARYRLLGQERYRKKAQSMSILMAFLVALAFNIDAGRVFVHVMTDRSAREALLDASPDILSSISEREQALAAAREEGAGAGEIRAMEDELAELRKLVDDNLGLLAENAALPIGFTYYPHCLIAPAINKAQQLAAEQGVAADRPALACVAGELREPWWSGLPIWFANVAIAGFLIGLGGPFWYKVFSGLSQLTQVLKKVGGGQAPKETYSDLAEAGGAPATPEDQVAAAVAAACRIRGIAVAAAD